MGYDRNIEVRQYDKFEQRIKDVEENLRVSLYPTVIWKWPCLIFLEALQVSLQELRRHSFLRPSRLQSKAGTQGSFKPP